MADLDQELTDAVRESAEGTLENQALQDSESASTEKGQGMDTPAVFLPAAAEPPQRNLALLVGLLVVAAAILVLVFTSVDEAAIYSVTTDQLVQQKEKYAGRNIRVEGDLVSGSLRQRKEPCEYRFAIQKNGKELPVRYAACIVPDTFKDVPGIDVQVTAEGKLNPEGYFEASHIMAKCPSKYEMEQRAKNGEAAPHELSDGPPPIEDEPTETGSKE